LVSPRIHFGSLHVPGRSCAEIVRHVAFGNEMDALCPAAALAVSHQQIVEAPITTYQQI
jgi:hypothetical protein